MCKAVSRSFYSRALNNSHTARTRILRAYTHTAHVHTYCTHTHHSTALPCRYLCEKLFSSRTESSGLWGRICQVRHHGYGTHAKWSLTTSFWEFWAENMKSGIWYFLNSSKEMSDSRHGNLTIPSQAIQVPCGSLFYQTGQCYLTGTSNNLFGKFFI